MEQKRLSLYQIDMKYIRDLANKDENVRSVSPQLQKEKRPFVGIVIVCSDKKYCIPLSSPKPKHEKMKNDVDFTRIYDKDKLLGVINFNNMIPVDESVIIPVKLKVDIHDSPEVKHYKKMTAKQLDWCQKNQDSIVTKANRLYKLVTETPEKSRNLTRRCCNFKKLESVLEKRLSKKQSITTESVKKGRSKAPTAPTTSRSTLHKIARKVSQESPQEPPKCKKHSHDIE